MPNCEICGEPMPKGEEMFKLHGYSGPCPRPPLQRETKEAVVEYLHRQDGDEYVLQIKANGELWQELRFTSAEERQRAHDDMLAMMRQCGAVDLPNHRQ